MKVSIALLVDYPALLLLFLLLFLLLLLLLFMRLCFSLGRSFNRLMYSVFGDRQIEVAIDYN